MNYALAGVFSKSHVFVCHLHKRQLRKRQTEEPIDVTSATAVEPPATTPDVVSKVYELEPPAAWIDPVQAELEPPTETSIEAVLEDIAKTEAKKQWAIKGLLLRIKESKAQLAKLGWTEDEPAWVAPTAKRKAGIRKVGNALYKSAATEKASKTAKAAGVKFCPVCNAETPTFPHDGRAHRYQTKKKAFTESELKALAAKAK